MSVMAFQIKVPNDLRILIKRSNKAESVLISWRHHDFDIYFNHWLKKIITYHCLISIFLTARFCIYRVLFSSILYINGHLWNMQFDIYHDAVNIINRTCQVHFDVLYPSAFALNDTFENISGKIIMTSSNWNKTFSALLSGVPDFFDGNKILSGGDLSHYQVPHCIRVFFYFVWFVFIHHNFQFYFELCTYCNILDIYLS